MEEKYKFEWKFLPDKLEMQVRFSIFSIIGASAGLPALVWSVRELIEHRKNGHRISVFIILLLLTDFAEVSLSPYILAKYLLNELCNDIYWTCRVFWSLRVYGLLLNQLVALEGLLSIRFPLYTATVFSSPCFKIFHILVFLSLTIWWIYLPILSIFLPLFLFIMYVIPWIISCEASCSAERHSHTSSKADPHTWVIFILNLLVLYLPFILCLFLLFCLFLHFNLYFLYLTLLLVSLRLISDPLLCVLVCRQKLRLQTSQKAEETSVA